MCACGPRSIDDFREEGNGVARSLIQELKQIHNREELVAAVPQIKIYFNKMITLMIQAEEWQKEHQAEVPELTKENHLVCDELRAQLTRISQIDGAGDLLELCQTDALERLHTLKIPSK